MNRTVLVTGATGFLGRTVCDVLHAHGYHVRALVRTPVPDLNVECVCWSGLDDEAAVRHAVQGADAVVHLAGRVHVMRDNVANSLAAFRHVNVQGTDLLARFAAGAGVSSFVFASSVKAMGEESPGRPWTEADAAAPVDPYGLSKLEAEYAVARVASETGMTTSVLRFPLIYGPLVGANMLRLFDLVYRGLPLPLGGIRNRRSLLYSLNAAAAILSVIERRGSHETWLVSDGHDVSTPELLQRIADALRAPLRLLPAPIGLLRASRRFRVPMLAPLSTRLMGSLAIDSTKMRMRLGGTMPHSLEEGLHATAAWYLSMRAPIRPT